MLPVSGILRRVASRCGPRPLCVLAPTSILAPESTLASPSSISAEPLPPMSTRIEQASAPVGRHGQQDGVVHLNVGGKLFVSLRSTIQRSPVLARTLERAEVQDSLRVGEAIFVDRDPKHFGTLLNHMRNEAEGIVLPSPSSPSARLFGREGPVPLPKEASELRALYVEAAHFGLEDLSSRLCSASILARIMMKLHMAGNPFDAATRLVAALRQGAIFMGGAGLVATTASGAVQSKASITPQNAPSHGTIIPGDTIGSNSIIEVRVSDGFEAATTKEAFDAGYGMEPLGNIRRAVATILYGAANRLEKAHDLGRELFGIVERPPSQQE